ncbi:MAG: hypothetical protein IKI33_04460, partial [Eubacterium sp.]|nr:hypothetical protein [Eubacterium sp.]
PKTFRLMNKSKKIESSTYDELKELYYEQGNRIDNYPELRICTLDEYLEKCVQFNITPVIELKGKNNKEHYDEIVKAVEGAKLEAIYISFEKEDLVRMRALTDDKLFLLSEKITDKVIKNAKEIKNCGIEFNANEEKNFEDKGKLIKQAQKEGLETAAWNVNEITTLDKLYKLNTFYYTTDIVTY